MTVLSLFVTAFLFVITMLEDVRGVKDEREIFLLFEDTDEDEDAIIDEEAWAIILMRA